MSKVVEKIPNNDAEIQKGKEHLTKYYPKVIEAESFFKQGMFSTTNELKEVALGPSFSPAPEIHHGESNAKKESALFTVVDNLGAEQLENPNNSFSARFNKSVIEHAEQLDIQHCGTEFAEERLIKRMNEKLEENIIRTLEDGPACITQGQRDEDWFNARLTRLTASNFGKIAKRRNIFGSDKLIADMLVVKDLSNIPAVKHGIDNEHLAFEAYKKTLPQGLFVEESGLWSNSKYSWLGASPDGIVYDSKRSNPFRKMLKIIEIKCPFSGINMTFDEFRSQGKSKTGFFLETTGEVTLNKKHDYYYQVQGGMGILNVQECDFIVYTVKETKVFTVKFDKDFFEEMVSKLRRFYFICFLPNICRMKEGVVPEYKELSEEAYAEHFAEDK